ncbi:hypothetical protein O181_075068, partial [Austropuccinia psidii MF-1]|nr:hypothetical protein [Austropuccinia psidii MF-1]
MHVPAVNQFHKLASRGIECKLLKPLMTGGWLLWEPSTNKMVQSASVVFPQFQPSAVSAAPVAKGSLSHVVNSMTLGEVPTECLFNAETQAIDSLFLAKDINIPKHLGKALSGPHCEQWWQACLAELDQMAARHVWEVVEKQSHMKTIGHQWVFDLKRKPNGSMERYKARLVARGNRQRPGVDCTETHAPTTSLMSLRLVLATAVLKTASGLMMDAEILDPTPFWSVIGSLAYLVGGSKPDLAFAVNYLARHSMGPTAEHWLLLDHIIGYLLKTRDCGIKICPKHLSLSLWSNAGQGGYLEHFQMGFIIKLGDALILWGSKCYQPAHSIGRQLQQDDILQQPGSSAGLHQQQVPEAHALPGPGFLFCQQYHLEAQNQGSLGEDNGHAGRRADQVTLGPGTSASSAFLRDHW